MESNVQNQFIIVDHIYTHIIEQTHLTELLYRVAQTFIWAGISSYP
jgi:hypothetical protein